MIHWLELVVYLDAEYVWQMLGALCLVFVTRDLLKKGFRTFTSFTRIIFLIL